MADVIYAVEVQLSAKGSLDPLSGVQSKISGLEGAFSKLGGVMSDFASGAANAFTGAVEQAGQLAMTMGKIGAVAVGGALAYGVGKLNNELEKAQIGLAAVFNANGVSGSMAEGMTIAADMMSKIRKDAAALPGETSDLLAIFRAVTIPGLRAGADTGRLEKLSANIMAAGAATGLDMATVAREAGALLSGRAGTHNILGSTLFGLTGAEAQKFNKESPAQRLEFLEKGMGKYSAAIDMYAKSFDGLSSSFRDNAKFFLTAATAPLFDRIKGVLSDANNWFDQNKDRVMGWATSIGDHLGKAFDFAKAKITEWAPAIREAFDRIHQVLTDPATWKRVEHVLELYAAVKVGQAAAGPAAGLMKGAGAIGDILGAGGGAAGALPEMLGALSVAGPIAAVALAGVGSALSVLADSSSTFHAAAVKQAEGAASSMTKVGETLSQTWDAVTERLLPSVNMMGTVFLGAVNAWSSAMEIGVKHLDMFVAGLGPLGTAIAALLHLSGDGIRQPKSFERTILNPILLSSNDAHFSSPRQKTGAGGGGGGTTVKIDKVEITVSTNQEPSRIARAVHAELANLQRHPRASRYVQNWSAQR